MSCCLYWVVLEERLSVRVLATAVDDWPVVNSNSCACVGIDNYVNTEHV